MEHRTQPNELCNILYLTNFGGAQIRTGQTETVCPAYSVRILPTTRHPGVSLPLSGMSSVGKPSSDFITFPTPIFLNNSIPKICSEDSATDLNVDLAADLGFSSLFRGTAQMVQLKRCKTLDFRLASLTVARTSYSAPSIGLVKSGINRYQYPCF